MNANQLRINISKCAQPYINNYERLSCARSQNNDLNLKLLINGVKVKQVDKITLLGVIIYDNWEWTTSQTTG